MGTWQERAEAEFCLRRKSDTCVVGFDQPKSLSLYRVCQRIKLFSEYSALLNEHSFLPACYR